MSLIPDGMKSKAMKWNHMLLDVSQLHTQHIETGRGEGKWLWGQELNLPLSEKNVAKEQRSLSSLWFRLAILVRELRVYAPDVAYLVNSSTLTKSIIIHSTISERKKLCRMGISWVLSIYWCNCERYVAGVVCIENVHADTVILQLKTYPHIGYQYQFICHCNDELLESLQICALLKYLLWFALKWNSLPPLDKGLLISNFNNQWFLY